ncbi:MAG: hypothetical protein HQ536_02580 [Parcubacteria group bacterium]|nr:hypothetical protein [Parcubacteria group bacterium]
MVRGKGKKEDKVENSKKLRKNSWTGEERKILNEKYEKAPKQELLEALAGRTWHGIRSQAIKLKLKRTAQEGWCAAVDKAIQKGFNESQDPKLTPEDRKRLRFRITSDVNDLAVANNLRVKKWNIILKRARKLELSWGVPEEIAKEQLALLESLWDPDILLAYLIERRTNKDLEKRFGEPIEAIEKKLPSRIDKYELISYRSSGKKTVFYYHERAQADDIDQPRVFSFIHPKDDDGNTSDCSLLVKFPDELDWRQIRILPLAELYYGSKKLFDKKRFVEYLKLAKRQYHFFILNGAFFANPVGGAEDRMNFLLEKEKEMEELLWPVAHKILWAHQGCTERVMERTLDHDPLESVCKKLGIPYFKRPIMAEVLWKKNNFSFYCIHGTTSAKFRGSMMNAIAGLLDQFEFVNFIVMSHPKSGKESIIPRYIRDRVGGMIRFEDQHLVLTPSFRLYDGSIEETKGHPLPSRGTCAMILFPDGECAYSD